MSQVRQFEPTSIWSNPDGTPSSRALGWMRSISDFVGATFGAIPAGSISGSGTSTSTFLRNDGVYAIPSYPTAANPTGTVGPTATNGVATTFMRSDGAPALDLTIAYTFTNSITAASLVAVGGFGCNSKAAQTSAAIGAAVVGTAATNAAPWGYATQAQADDIVARINTIRAALIANGILV